MLLALFFLVPLLLAPNAAASVNVVVNQVASMDTAGLGAMLRAERSPYKGVGATYDLVPLYLYEGRRIFVHASRVGLKLIDRRQSRLDLFLDYHFEGFPNDRTPTSLAGLKVRRPSVDLGIGYRYQSDWGNFDFEALHDTNNVSKGAELRLGYSTNWNFGRLQLRPTVTVSRRDAKLNDYYYGVSASEATATLPYYMPGAGTNWWLGVYGMYDLTAHWRMLGAAGVNILSSNISNSPIVGKRTQPGMLLGFAYDFGGDKPRPATRTPLRLKLLYGHSTNCNLLPIMTLRCASVSTQDNTRIAAVEIGRVLAKRVNGWPLDFVGYVGLLRHNDNGLQPNSLQLDAYVQAYYYGFPWSKRVRTRLGMGAGFSLAQRVPYVEVRDQARRGRNTSKLLNYLDPTIDVSVGDLLATPSLKDTYFGFGVSHRSGIFGSSQLLGNVNGGSNFIYSYIETGF